MEEVYKLKTKHTLVPVSNEQRHSKARQQKLAYMEQFGLKTGKQYRRHIKAMRKVV
jgi:hypothetical protein